jgi:hypothetical protein
MYIHTYIHTHTHTDQIRIQFASSSLTGYLADKVISHATFAKTLLADTIRLRTQLEQALAGSAQTQMTVLHSAANSHVVAS